MDMAYDPEAREQSSSAMIIAVVAVVLIVLGAFAWFATRGGETPPTDTPVATIERDIERNTETVREVPVPDSSSPDTVIIQPESSTPSTSTRTDVTIRQPSSGSETDSGTASDSSSTTGTADTGENSTETAASNSATDGGSRNDTGASSSSQTEGY